MKNFAIPTLTEILDRFRGAFCHRTAKPRRQPNKRSWNSLGRSISAERLELRWVPSAVPISATPVAVAGFEGAPLNNVPVATFTAGDGSLPASQFSAVISWGDGSITNGTVTEFGTTYIVTGSHTYADENKFPLIVGITETGAGPTFAVSQARIAPLLPDGTQGTPDQRYVYEVLQDTLQRPISMDEVNFWTGQFIKNHEDRQTFGYILLEVTPPYEYRRGEIESAYQTFLHRAADPAGENYFLNLVNSTQGIHSGPGTERRTSAILMSSQEYYVNRGGGTNAGFITAIFEDVLKRAPDAPALAFYEQELAMGVTHVELAGQILNSIEAETRSINNLFERYLDRPADPAGLQAFLFNLSQGYGTENNTETILDTDEYYNKAVGNF